MGWIGTNGTCHSSIKVAAHEILFSQYPTQLATTTTVKATATSGLEAISSLNVTASSVTYSTVNNRSGQTIQTNSVLGMHQCVDADYQNDIINGQTYDYASAAAMWSFAFVTVFSLWYLSKNLGMIINAVKRF